MLQIECRKCGNKYRRRMLAPLQCACCRLAERSALLVYRLLDEDGRLWVVASKQARISVLQPRKEARAAAKRAAERLRRLREGR